ncbi:MAG: hypothetical protein M3R02_12575 [Chloroflexota bacterium]|nr:hypothetical protein [Chloroflexota bacterium]
MPEAPQLAAPWYAFGVGEKTSLIHRPAMVSRSHYMVDDYYDFDAPLLIEPLDITGSPATLAVPSAT